MNIGDKLKEKRQELNISQNELAKRLKVSQQKINYYESNKYTPKIDFCIKLADFYDISLDELVGREGWY